VYLTDINEIALANARFNAELNGLLAAAAAATEAVEAEAPTDATRPVVEVLKVNWQDPGSFPPLPGGADVVLGSDLVYDAGILRVLVPAVAALLRPGGLLLYTCPAAERDGMAELVAVSWCIS
jgi:predicted nicotinamide N-methyase